jgi:hypothetical protein
MTPPGAIQGKRDLVTQTGMYLRDLLQDAEFRSRKPRTRQQSEADAFRTLAHVFAEQPGIVLQTVVDTATAYCGADSAGISLEEPGDDGQLHFRWVAVSGSFAGFVNGVTPRFYSPCGTTLSSGRPQLYSVTKAYYDFLGIEAQPIRDGILIPWESGTMRGTIWAVSHSPEVFDFEDFKLLDVLADFASIVIRDRAQQKSLREQQAAGAAVSVASDLAHSINNPLQGITNALYLAEHGAKESRTAALHQAKEEVARVAEVVKKLLLLNAQEIPAWPPGASTLGDCQKTSSMP